MDGHPSSQPEHNPPPAAPGAHPSEHSPQHTSPHPGAPHPAEGAPTFSPDPTYPPYPPYQPTTPYSPYPPYAPYPPYYMPPPAPPKRGGVPWYVWLIGGCLGAVILTGVACVLLGVAASHVVRTLSNVTSNSAQSSQTFAVTGTPRVVAHLVDGSITVKTGSPGAVTVDITTHATDLSPADVQRDLSQLAVTPTQNGNTISLISTTGGSASPITQLSTDVVITVPPSADLDLIITTGTVEIADVQGTISASISSGDFTAQGIKLSDGSDIAVTAGTATINGALAPGASATVSVDTGAATLTLPPATACHVDATVDTGSIDVSGWTIPVTQNGAGARASGDLGAHPGGTLTLRVGAGTIVLAQGT